MERTPGLWSLMADSRFPLFICCPWNIHRNPYDPLFRMFFVLFCLFTIKTWFLFLWLTYVLITWTRLTQTLTGNICGTKAASQTWRFINDQVLSRWVSTHRRVGAVQQTQHQQHEPPPLVHFKKQQPFQLRVRYPRNINVRRHRPNLGGGGRGGFSTVLH